tara:strand:+ start:159 stop:680 length:522 start_codon:yes stop_codon:yes gene_type:complete
MKIFLLLFLCLSFFSVSCSQIRESAGVNRKNIDEFKVIENPPLIIPPNFNLLPPDQISDKNIDNTDIDLAQEILLGLNNDNNDENVTLTTIEYILTESKANGVSENIRKEIDEQFAQEKPKSLSDWNDEVEILDSINESERLRNQLLGNTTDVDESVPTISIKNKKKKRFFFF